MYSEDAAFILWTAAVWLLEGLNVWKGNLNDEKVVMCTNIDHWGYRTPRFREMHRDASHRNRNWTFWMVNVLRLFDGFGVWGEDWREAGKADGEGREETNLVWARAVIEKEKVCNIPHGLPTGSLMHLTSGLSALAVWRCVQYVAELKPALWLTGAVSLRHCTKENQEPLPCIQRSRETVNLSLLMLRLQGLC